ncbi:sensor histidine kinase [Adhaeribacter rhizoryzae]|uniref:histidine kinase n=1 Tax=Adhaeribacter rhizoryzae TaxID=2607907 RepID=A0A5M6DQV2_9BACT|nr:ATP-binding protein [Adhaeribacter rhizoryzae]KAA5548629.1 ATP-binding protein [Adhaeribacter rhizoryzae]
MAYNKFRLRVLLRFMLLLAITGGFWYVLLYRHWYITAFCLFLVLLALLFDLFHYLEKTNRELVRFFSAIRYEDFTQRFPNETRTGSFADLYQELNNTIAAFQRIKADKEANHLYLQNLVAHMRIGIITFNEAGEVNLMNQAAKDLLQVPHLTRIHGLQRVSPELTEAMETLENEESKLVVLNRSDEQLLLTVKASTFRLQGQALKIISLQNIRSEMEEKELDAWQKLIRVLSHEIMNSITPVISLTNSLGTLVEAELINRENNEEPDEEIVQDIRTGLETIEKRSAGLLHFVEKYRKLTRIPNPRLQPLNLNELLKGIQQLVQRNFRENGVILQLQLPDAPLLLQADGDMLEQVIINLVKNALEACQECPAPQVEIKAYTDPQENNRVKVDVKDNGKGIPEEILDQIFVPFYTTKRHGSGIGLSLSRQIMRLHKGSLRVSSTAPSQTVFTLVF